MAIVNSYVSLPGRVSHPPNLKVIFSQPCSGAMVPEGEIPIFGSARRFAPASYPLPDVQGPPSERHRWLLRGGVIPITQEVTPNDRV